MDAIRGLAAILVMFGHSRDLFFHSLSEHSTRAVTMVSGRIDAQVPAQPRITMGNEAVMIFFVLSGYLVGGSVLRSFRRDRWSWKEYLTKRLTRLWMVLIPALALTLLLDHAGLRIFPEPTSIYQGPVGQIEVRSDLAHTLTPEILLGNAVFLQDIVVTTPGTNIALWSLSNEFWYYILFPLLVFVFWRYSSTAARLASAVSVAGLLLFIGADEAILFPTWLLGVGVGVLPLRLSERSSRWLLLLFGGLMFPFMVAVRVLPWNIHLAQSCVALYFGGLLYIMLNRNSPTRNGAYQWAAGVLSDLSYPLYLVHLPILVFLCAAINRPWHQWTRTPGHFALMLGVDSATLVAAYLFHLCFQRHTEALRLSLLGRLQRQQHVPVAKG
jgi:peptidoglycan/LPS O-acetylase OafA/YrhL